MPRPSAGLILYRRTPPRTSGASGLLEVLLVHPGGPYWARRDEGAWSIPKGEVGDGEEPLAAAEREVTEELGRPVPPGPRRPLGEIVQQGGKRVSAWAVAANLDPATVVSNTFELEWPPRSGTPRTFPEVDRAAWFALDDARRRILPSQAGLLDRLASTTGPGPGTGAHDRPQ
ncbi:MAG: NUDIX domain-containing protein [Acidimicrobiales bacterium]